MSCKGRNVTAEYSKGADVAVSLAERNGCKMALLKEKSPSCGSGVIYDGTFTGRLIAGDGLAAERLKARGVRVRGESEVDGDNLNPWVELTTPPMGFVGTVQRWLWCKLSFPHCSCLCFGAPSATANAVTEPQRDSGALAPKGSPE